MIVWVLLNLAYFSGQVCGQNLWWLFPVMGLALVCAVAASVNAAVQARHGRRQRYPAAIPFIRP